MNPTLRILRLFAAGLSSLNAIQSTECQRLARLVSGRDTEADWAEVSTAASQALIDSACRHGVAALLHAKLSETGQLERLGPAAADALRQYHLGQAVRSARLFTDLETVLSALDRAAVPVRLLKGAALAHTAYADPSERPMCDVDLLIPEERLDEAGAALEQIGFHPKAASAPGKWEGMEQSLYIHRVYTGPSPRHLPCELHWHIVAGRRSRYAPDMAWFWKEGSMGSCPSAGPSDAARPGLSPTAILLHLCAHVMLQNPGRRRRLIWYCDIDRVTQMEVDWEVFVRQADRFHWSAAAAAALRGARELLGTALPEGLLQRLDAAIERRDERMLGLIDRCDSEWESARIMLRQMDWPMRCRTLAGVLFPGRKYLSWRYGDGARASRARLYVRRWRELGARILRGRPNRPGPDAEDEGTRGG